MKYLFTIFAISLILGCGTKTYHGYIYDYDTKMPIAGTVISDYVNGTKAVSDNAGYFSLEHKSRLSGKLIFTKAGYRTDTLETIRISYGERQAELFKGDTTYLFKDGSRLSDTLR